MEIGHFYFVKNDFFDEFGTAEDVDCLMRNKKEGSNSDHNRPHICVALDDDGVGYFVPTSTQVEKYRGICESKMAKNKPANMIDFAHIRGVENAFLIQNMIAIMDEYIQNEYVDGNKCSIRMSGASEKKVIKKATKAIISLEKGGRRPYTDIEEIREKLREKATA